MPAITRAGVELAQRVLWISAGAILLFMLYLLAMELVVGHEVSSLFRLGQECRHSGAPFLMLARMEQFAHDLDQAQHDPAWVAPAGSLENARNVAASLALLPGMTLAQTGQLKECVELLSAVGDRASKLAPCESLLEAERKDAVQAESTAISVQMADDAATRLNDHRQSLHQFWLQAAQLVLLNLLLPVLTAILGYTFGARQEQKAP
jgi:hypothetical protein